MIYESNSLYVIPAEYGFDADGNLMRNDDDRDDEEDSPCLATDP